MKFWSIMCVLRSKLIKCGNYRVWLLWSETIIEPWHYFCLRWFILSTTIDCLNYFICWTAPVWTVNASFVSVDHHLYIAEVRKALFRRLKLEWLLWPSSNDSLSRTSLFDQKSVTLVVDLIQYPILILLVVLHWLCLSMQIILSVSSPHPPICQWTYWCNVWSFLPLFGKRKSSRVAASCIRVLAEPSCLHCRPRQRWPNCNGKILKNTRCWKRISSFLSLLFLWRWEWQHNSCVSLSTMEEDDENGNVVNWDNKMQYPWIQIKYTRDYGSQA